MINTYEACGYASGILFSASLFPQLYRSCRTKELDDISIYWQCIFIIAIIFGLIYSFHYNLKPIIISSSIEMIIMIILLVMKLYYKKDIKYNDIENP